MVPEKKILIICYYFPPLGGAGVSRPLALFKHLSENGYECHILTVKPVAYRAFEPELLDNLDTRHIYRAGSFDPQRMLYLLGIRQVKDKVIQRSKPMSDRFFPDSKVGWVRSAMKLGRQLVSNYNYHAIVSTSPPISTHLVGMQLSKETGLPWIADFRDFWTSYPVEECYTRPELVTRGQRLLNEIKQQSTAITTVNNSIAQYLGNATVITNCYDSELVERWQAPGTHNKFVIGLLGTYSDIYPVEPLLKVLDELRRSAPDCYEKTSILQIGNINSTWLNPQLERFGLSDRFQRNSFLPRSEAITKLLDTAMLYIGLPSVREAAFTTGRIFYMLASGRPILAGVPRDSEIEKLVSESNQGFCFEDNQISDAVDYLSNQIRQFTSGAVTIKPLPDYSRKYSSENMARQFAELLNSLA